MFFLSPANYVQFQVGALDEQVTIIQEVRVGRDAEFHETRCDLGM